MRRSAFALLALLALLTGCSATPAPSVTVTVPGPTVTVEVAAPTVTVTAEPDATDTLGSALTDEQRATLDTQFGRALGTDGPLGKFCPMDTAGRKYYADLVARQLDGYTSGMVLTYLVEACGN